MLINIIFAIWGLIAGGIINWLADDLPKREGIELPRCIRCEKGWGPAGSLAITRRITQPNGCPQCDLPPRLRPLLVEISTTIFFFILPFLILEPIELIINSSYIAVLILVIVTDLEHRLIFHAVTFPMTLVAVLLSFVALNNNWYLALAGALAGFLIFLFFYWLGQLLFGPGALGFGDVTLSMMMGAMLGFHRIISALIIGIIIGAVVSTVLLIMRRAGRKTIMAYGPYLAVAGISMLIWGMQLLDWYLQ